MSVLWLAIPLVVALGFFAARWTASGGRAVHKALAAHREVSLEDVAPGSVA